MPQDRTSSPGRVPASRPVSPARPRAPDARARAFAALAEGVRTFPEGLPETIDESGLDPRDAALAHAILEGAVRHWITLEYLLSGFMRQPLRSNEPGVRGALLGGAAQIVVLDRVPVHAALDTCVEWVKHALRPGAGALVNAVLRRVSELVLHGPNSTQVRRSTWSGQRDELPLPDGSVVVLAQPVLPEPAIERLSIATGNPLPLVARWIDHFGEARARDLALHSLVRAPTVLNIAHARSPLVAPPGVRFIPHDQPGAVVAEMTRADLLSLLSARRDVWVQDASATLAVQSVADLRPSLVLDLCAGRGTKTRQLAMTFPNAEIVACDPDPARARVLADLPTSYPNVRVTTSGDVRARAVGRADLILLDVPCSNTGVLARRLGAKHRCGSEQLARLVALQQQILRDARALLVPGGTILYSTCSLEHDENGGAARDASQAGLSVRTERFTLPVGLPGEAPSSYRDGSYSAILTA